MGDSKWYTSSKVNTWKQILNLYAQKYGKQKRGKTRWIFRGERVSDKLQTVLEKKFKLNGIKTKVIKYKYEIDIVREFQRKASLYLQHEPDKDDILEWLALMQHHGASTRLLDWTYSFFNAVYFALAENKKGLVWSFNAATVDEPKKIEITFEDIHRYHELVGYFKKKNDILQIRSLGDKLEDLAIACYLVEKRESMIYAINPFKLNKRLTVQQGLFLITGDIANSFEANLKEYFDKVKMSLKDNIHRIEINPTTDERKNIMRNLRNMNITNETLFPDLGGFAKSVGECLAYPEVFPHQ